MNEFIAPNPDTKVFVISVAAEISGLHPQTLRTYDRLGLVSPGRTPGGGRRYSLRDIEMLVEVARLTAEGLGLEGVKRVLDLERKIHALTDRIAVLENELAIAQQTLQTNANLPVPFTSRHVTVWRRA